MDAEIDIAVAPRLVPRSDVRDKATGTRAPLYALAHPWPAGMLAQGGTKSLIRDATEAEEADPGTRTYGGKVVYSHDVFLEIFPRDPATFMRAEAPTFTEAEDTLWARWEAITTCPGHEYETRGYTNGAGVCGRCGLFSSGVFDLAAIGSVCLVCGVGTNWTHVPRLDDEGRVVRGPRSYDFACPEHAPPSFADVDAHMQHDPEDPPGRPLTEDQERLVLDVLAGRGWRDLDFDARWALAAQVARADIAAQQTRRRR